jgi:prevent-host-death family protein
MQTVHQTIAADDLRAKPTEAFAMLAEGPVVVLGRAEPKAVLVSVDEWNRIAKRLKMLEALVEAQRIEARNDANQTWVTNSELKQRLAQRGVDVGSSL